MRGLLDWGAPRGDASARRFGAFERDDHGWVLPTGLALDSEPNGSPAFRLTAFRSVGAGGAAQGYGRLDIGFRFEGAADTPTERLAPPLRGALWLHAPSIDLPPALAAPIGLDCSGIGLAQLTVPLASEDVVFVERAISDDTLPLFADAAIEVQGVAARLPGTAEIDLARLAVLIVDRGMSREALVAEIARDADEAGVTLRGVGDASPGAIAEAVADRVRALLCAGPLVADRTGVLTLRLAGVARGKASFDLAEPVGTSRAVALRLDPFGAARTLAASAGGMDMLIVRRNTSPIGFGRHSVTIASTIARPLTGPLAITASLRFPPRIAARTHEVRFDFELPRDGSDVSYDVTLAPGEPLDWTMQAFALWPAQGGTRVERIDGPVQQGTGAFPLLRPDALPLLFVTAEADPALLALADVRLVLSGGAAGATMALLTAATPRMTLALPQAVGAPLLAATLVAHADGAELALPARPAGGWRLALGEVPGFGAHAIEIDVEFRGDADIAVIEIVAEDANEADAQTLAFTPARSRRSFRWLCHDPFRPGVRWRWRGQHSFAPPVRDAHLILTPEALPV